MSSDDRICDPRPKPERLPEDVPLTIVSDTELTEFADALAESRACAIDTETVFSKTSPAHKIGSLRVVSAATRNASGEDHSWVVDVRSVDNAKLTSALSGVSADAWNANFDARVIERDLFQRFGTSTQAPVWWDVMLADALLHQGVSGFDFFHSLAWASEWYLGLQAQGKGTTQISFTADGELSQEQLQYAAADAVETLWIGQIVRSRLTEAGLEQVCQLEQEARPFLEQMQRSGLAVDKAAWQAELDVLAQRRSAISTRLAQLTGGGQSDLFDEHLQPAWNLNSEHDARRILNTFDLDRVERWTESQDGFPRPLQESDGLTAMTLQAIGGEIAESLLEFRETNKILSTYGEGLLAQLRSDGRFHPSYLQVVGTNTGRLASRNPNAQNLTPRIKPFINPAPGCVFVYADLSQAELRFAAQIANDATLQAAFVQGLDIHESTAREMFGVDMAQLRREDSQQHELMRTKAKRINFGILYGLRGAGLALSLTEDGVPTQRQEAEELIETYLKAYPGIGAWVAERDDFISKLAVSPPSVDWQLTLRLYDSWVEVDQRRRMLRDNLERSGVRRRHFGVEEVVDQMAEPGQTTLGLAEVAWCLSFAAPVVLCADGQPLSFDSRTQAGRRQRFTLRTEGVLGQAGEIVADSTKPGPQQAWELALQRSGTGGQDGDRGGSAGQSSANQSREASASKLLENRQLRRGVIDAVAEVMGNQNLEILLRRALRSRISQLANAYRNAPVQGGVADVMLDAYARLHSCLAEVDGARGVQTVHDSVVVECRKADADHVARLVRHSLEAAMQRWCPDVPAVADTDIRLSLSDKDVVSTL